MVSLNSKYVNLSIIFMVSLLYYIQHLISFRLGIFFEECREGNIYLLAMQGYLPYRDLDWFYGPLSFFIYPFILKVFGINLLVLRVSYMIFGSLIIPLSYFLARRILPYHWAGIAAFLSVIFFRIPYYTYNHVFAVLGELASLLMLCRFIEVRRIKTNLFWAGIFCSITLLTKPFLWGISLYITASLFLFLVDDLERFFKKIKNFFIFTIGSFIPLLIYLFYFYFQTGFKNLDVDYPPFYQKVLQHLLFGLLIRINLLDTFLWLIHKFINIFPLHDFLSISSFIDFKKLYIAFFDSFIYFIPFIVSFILILLIYVILKSNKISTEIKEKIYKDKRFLLLFIIFTIFISLESIGTHGGHRPYTIQVPFILLVYILYYIKTVYSHRPANAKILIILFLFFVVFIDFFYYPYSVLKRYKSQTGLLKLDYAKGIIVSPEEKKLYESLTYFLQTNFDKKDKMVIVGYYPQFSFLTKQKNIFEDEEFIFVQLRILFSMSDKNEKIKSVLAMLENKIIFRIEKEKPRILLMIAGDYFYYSKYLSLKIKSYIEKNYTLEKIFGLTDICGMGSPHRGQVELYTLRETGGNKKQK